MRTISLVVLAGVFLLGACDSAYEPMAPEMPEPVEPFSHEVLPGLGPDGDYSMYYFDLNLFKNLVVKVGQSWSPSAGWPEADDLAQCPGSSVGHAFDDFEGGPEEAGDPGSWPQATGFGFFSYRQLFRGRTRGHFVVTNACWFDEWNGQGFPESAWVRGELWPSGDPFFLKLESGGFPAPEQGVHDHSLDKAVLYLDGEKVMSYTGELHHEDGLSLIG